MKFVICEDEPEFINQMQSFLQSWGHDRQETVFTLSYASAEELLFKKEEWADADGLILDIELKQMNGMALAQEIRAQDAHMPILFATGYEQFVFEGYEVGAVSYLMKPIQEAKLFAALDRIREQSRTRQEVILTEAGDESVRIYLADLLYIESIGHYVLLHTRTGTLEVHRSIGSFREELPEKDFCMPHRSYLAGIAHISKITKKSLFLDDGTELPIARGKWEEINQAYLSYYRKNT